MLYLLFMVLAIAYNWVKFVKERSAFLSSLIEAKHPGHREMILSHHFYIFIFEGFLALIVAHLITERAGEIGLLGLGAVYVALIFLGFFIYRFFIRHIEKQTELELFEAFRVHITRDLRVNFAIILLPILVYSLINYAFQDTSSEAMGNWWFLNVIFNVIFVSVLTIACSVVIMLRLIPNREITEPEYLEIINNRLDQIQMSNMRVRWIETDIKNAFVVGLKLLSFSNQTMFIGRSLRKTLTLEEFDAVIAHEVAHIANRHIHKRVIDLMKNFIIISVGLTVMVLAIFAMSYLYWGEDTVVHGSAITGWMVAMTMGWVFFNYSLMFDTIRSHEFEADAYAVMELGANFQALESALHKLTTTEELPEYLKKRAKNKDNQNRFTTWIKKNFSTHPDIETRVRFLEYKISLGLPFNYYVSTPKKIRLWLGDFFTWKVSVPLASVLLVSLVWMTFSARRGQQDIAFLENASTREIMANKELIERINDRPVLVERSLMFFVVKRKEPALIDYFLTHGADKGRTLMYIALFKDSKLFEEYYRRYEDSLTEGDYSQLLMRTARMDFTEGYRLLVNAKRFENLKPSYKEDLSRMHDLNRAPASEK